MARSAHTICATYRPFQSCPASVAHNSCRRNPRSKPPAQLRDRIEFCCGSPKEKISVRRLKERRGMILIHCRKKGWQSAEHGETGPMAKNDSGWSESTQRQRMGKQRREAGGRRGLLYRPRTTMPSGSEALFPIRHALSDAVIRRHRRIRSIVYRGRS